MITFSIPLSAGLHRAQTWAQTSFPAWAFYTDIQGLAVLDALPKSEHAMYQLTGALTRLATNF